MVDGRCRDADPPTATHVHCPLMRDTLNAGHAHAHNTMTGNTPHAPTKTKDQRRPNLHAPVPRDMTQHSRVAASTAVCKYGSSSSAAGSRDEAVARVGTHTLTYHGRGPVRIRRPRRRG